MAGNPHRGVKCALSSAKKRPKGPKLRFQARCTYRRVIEFNAAWHGLIDGK